MSPHPCTAPGAPWEREGEKGRLLGRQFLLSFSWELSPSAMLDEGRGRHDCFEEVHHPTENLERKTRGLRNTQSLKTAVGNASAYWLYKTTRPALVLSLTEDLGWHLSEKQTFRRQAETEIPQPPWCTMNITSLTPQATTHICPYCKLRQHILGSTLQSLMEPSRVRQLPWWPNASLEHLILEAFSQYG